MILQKIVIYGKLEKMMEKMIPDGCKILDIKTLKSGWLIVYSDEKPTCTVCGGSCEHSQIDICNSCFEKEKL